MSVLRTENLPEVPAVISQDSARSRAAARWATGTAPVATADAAPVVTAPGRAAHPGPANGRAAHPQAVPPQATRPHAARGRAASLPLRLTRRGSVVVAVAVALLLAALSLVIAASAQATNHPAPSGAAQRNLTQVTVRPGQSLWSVAENADPDADTRVVVQQIIELNGLAGTVVFVGQRLWVPRG